MLTKIYFKISSAARHNSDPSNRPTESSLKCIYGYCSRSAALNIYFIPSNPRYFLKDWRVDSINGQPAGHKNRAWCFLWTWNRSAFTNTIKYLLYFVDVLNVICYPLTNLISSSCGIYYFQSNLIWIKFHSLLFDITINSVKLLTKKPSGLKVNYTWAKCLIHIEICQECIIIAIPTWFMNTN